MAPTQQQKERLLELRAHLFSRMRDIIDARRKIIVDLEAGIPKPTWSIHTRRGHPRSPCKPWLPGFVCILPWALSLLDNTDNTDRVIGLHAGVTAQPDVLPVRARAARGLCAGKQSAAVLLFTIHSHEHART